MSDLNKSILAKANTAIRAGHNENFLSHCTEDTTWIFVGDITLRGKDAVRKWMKKNYHTPPRFTVKTMISDGDMLVAIGVITLKGKDGQDETHEYCDVWRFDGGKLAELTAYVVKAK